ncbi:sugar transferase [Mediterraneibacter sp. NSJ-55]|uniref:Sugar transferase n=1 Tax=Mediterraneibacter hominis TaxID=2763054 RepID=A0A923LG59_9FIRM|nr:sugar transferase [Mediterraneibacter hominis]MBC5687516.1 sugar transferase [Mediterraneibacter hominis]
MRKWENLPEDMQVEEVKKYYNILQKHKGSLLLKRIFDIIAAGLLLIILSPILLILSVWIKADSKGPVFFRQVRVTQYGKTFRIFKFRTMVNHADKMGTQVTTKGDARVTKAGKALRGCRLDELPQLLNILTGDMTFVGTRPEVEKYVVHYTNEMKATLLLPAGVTSLASIEYKDEERLLESADNADQVYIETILPEKMAYNLRAIEKFSFWQDIKTMIATVVAVMK